MAQGKKGRSGRGFFIAAILIIFAAIVCTALGANDLRNLNRVLRHFGYPPVSTQQLLFFIDQADILPHRTAPVVRIVKGVRLPAPTMHIPRYAYVGMGLVPTTFVRAIRVDPRGLCDALRANGFPDVVWTAGALDGHGSECSSFLSIGRGLPAGAQVDAGPPPRPETVDTGDDAPSPDDEPLADAPPDDPPPPHQSSVFVLLKGDARGRVLSFRVKFNIEVSEDKGAVIAAGSRAVDSFLKEVHWQDDGEMLRQIAALSEFDRDDFGSHIVFKREYGDLPRFNFLARQSEKKRRTIGDAFFDSFAWLPPSDGGPSIWMPKSGLKAMPLPKTSQI